MLGIVPIVYAWEKPVRPAHVITVFLSEELAHHAFFARRANKIHHGEGHESGPSGEPVLQQQSLGETKKPDGGVHGVANRTVNAVLDQLMAFAQLQRDGPVPAQIGMGALEEPKRGRHDGRATPGNEGR